ncbi:MAG: EF-P beta-lysylation protein EpmB [Gammaproteobacteria bacterium]|nr:EF-P beta-lysylation protein EpmB [Gammaproteobacteria bacterium]
MSWQKTLAQGFHSVNALLEFLNLPPTIGSSGAERLFKTRLTRHFAKLIEPGNPHDPLLLQVLATQDELQSPADFSHDPLSEKQANRLPGLIHKYHGRVLLMPTGACAIHCRYCFRRHFPYADNQPSRTQWQDIFNDLKQHPDIKEVILSGGDPLLTTDSRLHFLLDNFAAISHIETVRFHTRVPIVLPERITPEWLALFDAKRFNLVMVLHCNHPNEITPELAAVCQNLKKSGFHLLNQAVLLKHVNHEPRTLIALNKQLFAIGVLPYYLHLLDSVDGAAHFDLSLDEALSVYQHLQAHLPGYLVPRLVKEIPGQPNKTLIIGEAKITTPYA